MENKKVRDEARNRKVPLWEIAQFLGISEATMTRMMRIQLSPEKEAAIMEAIEKLSVRRLEVT